MTDSSGWLAFLDESMPHPRPGIEPCYIIAAALIEAADCDDVRWTVSKLAGKHDRFHWRDAKAPSRRTAVNTVSQVSALHLLVIGAPLVGKQERIRAKTLERMLYELHERKVHAACLESRTSRLNRRDQHTVDNSMTSGLISSRLRVHHEKPEVEPLLWIPDIVAGAIGSGDEAFRASLKPLMEITQVNMG